MDNLTHTLVGLAAGELIDRALPKGLDAEEAKLRRRLIVFSSAAANNFPDLDFVLNPLLPSPLNYLLLHRGHTHTLVWIIPQLLLLVGAIILLRPSVRELLKKDRITQLGLLIATVSGFILHMAFDYLNSYGVHPFHPFDSRWFYGDMVFIIEPVLWAIFGGVYFSSLNVRWVRVLGLLVVFAAPLIFTLMGYLPPMMLVLFVILGLIQFLAFKKTSVQSSRPFIIAAFLALTFIITQNVTRNFAHKIVTNDLLLRHPGAVVSDISLTAYPSNPACWIFHAVSSDEANDHFYLDTGVVSALPHLSPVSSCPEKFLAGKTLSSVSENTGWIHHFRVKLSDFRTLAQDNCFFEAWLRFARVPLLTGDFAVDIRYARGKLLSNFTSLSLKDFQGKACPAFVPGWIPPRTDLLQK